MQTQREFADSYRPCLSMLLYAEVANDDEARMLAQEILSQLQDCAPVVLQSFSRYWKIPAYYGFDFDFAPNSTHDAAFDCLAGFCQQGWSFSGSLPERSAVWNPKDGAILLAEKVRWGHVQLRYSQE